MEKRFDKLEEKLDNISDDLFEIKVTQAEQAKDLKYHIKRTDQIENALLPIVEVKNKVDGAFKVLGMIGTGLGILFAGVKAIETFIRLL